MHSHVGLKAGLPTICSSLKQFSFHVGTQSISVFTSGALARFWSKEMVLLTTDANEYEINDERTAPDSELLRTCYEQMLQMKIARDHHSKRYFL